MYFKKRVLCLCSQIGGGGGGGGAGRRGHCRYEIDSIQNQLLTRWSPNERNNLASKSLRKSSRDSRHEASVYTSLEKLVVCCLCSFVNRAAVLLTSSWVHLGAIIYVDFTPWKQAFQHRFVFVGIIFNAKNNFGVDFHPDRNVKSQGKNMHGKNYRLLSWCLHICQKCMMQWPFSTHGFDGFSNRKSSRFLWNTLWDPSWILE